MRPTKLWFWFCLILETLQSTTALKLYEPKKDSKRETGTTWQLIYNAIRYKTAFTLKESMYHATNDNGKTGH